ncbi:hypothetical protein GSI_05729 [Ganoderma sinense ZZ0214-1]|uniref:Uncharacterized protein n=1 Tax=Ganoderma sinense ZZ0214-1 TaxID=1077348 RepID=A0A2G8SB91_9APHY|nr:hypothetical protein GSI_05729 [Ganoderma sinense ZZ0214-1]
MSPLPLARRNVLSQSVSQLPTLSLSADVLAEDDVHDESLTQAATVTVTVTVTTTEWGTPLSPGPTSTSTTSMSTSTSTSTSSMSGMSRDAMGSLATSTEPPLVLCPTSEMLAHPTASSATSGGGASSGSSSLRTGLVTGAATGAVVGILMVIAVAVVYVLHRRRRCVRAALRPRARGACRDDGCRSERSRPRIDATPSRAQSRGTGTLESSNAVRPYSGGYSSWAGEELPSYDALSSREACTVALAVAVPEPVVTLLAPSPSSRKGAGATQHIANSPSEFEGSRSPSTETVLTVSTRGASTST